jgi:hypothetical protein
MRSLLVAAVVLMFTAGCGVNTTFVYKTNTPAEGGPTLPVKVAVLPFNDGTEDFTKRGSLFAQEGYTYNLAKSGIGDLITALTPDLWAKAFADDLAASGAFRAVRFIYSPSELVDEEFTIEGTLGKANTSSAWDTPSEFALGLRALRRADNRLAWEKEVARAWKTPRSVNDGCWMGQQCIVDRRHAEINGGMQSIFAEARADFVATLAGLSGSRGVEGGLPPAASPGKGPQDKGASSPPAPESVEQTIDKILKGK